MKKVKVLSIDGGGIRGIIHRVILQYIEEQLQKKGDSIKKLGDFFDFIASTSTGSILACCYLMQEGSSGKAKYSSDKTLNMYLREDSEIFHQTFEHQLLSGFNFLDEKYNNEVLLKNLQYFFGETMLDKFIKLCLISSYEITARNTHFFNSAEAKNSLYNFKVKYEAKATSAAPTYFQPATIFSESGQQFTLIGWYVCQQPCSLCLCRSA